MTFNIDEIENILAKNNYKESEFFTLPFSLGEYAYDKEDFYYAENILIKLMEHSDNNVRANAVLGVAYLARNHKKLTNKNKIIKIIKKELKENTEYKERIEDAIDDINIFLKLKINY